jgi:hypothetical protein
VTDSLDTSAANPARRYDYWLGGKDNFAADRHSGHAVEQAFPGIKVAVRENRLFMKRAVALLAGQHMIRQFLDIGPGLPRDGATHEVAQAADPSCRVVYADNDPLVMTHARALLTSTLKGTTEYVEADLRLPETILGSAAVKNVLDLSQPTALLLGAVLHFVPDADQPYQAVDHLMQALAPGSYLVLTHATYDLLDEDTIALLNVELAKPEAGQPVQARTRDEISRFFHGLELVTPGQCIISQWRPGDDAGIAPDPRDVSIYGAVARKPGSVQ